jgi:hypothetical protein
VHLCLQVNEHVEDFVDAWFGPASMKEDALADGMAGPERLREDALALLDDIPGEDLEDDRVRWLIGQVRGIECVTARLAGEDVTWSDEVERCFGIRPAHVDEEEFRAAHRRLDDVLPGSGDLSARYNAWLASAEVPRETLPQVVEVLSAELRRRTAGIVDLPPGESVEYETITGEPWQAFNAYRGDLLSLVRVNVELPFSITDLADLVAHEAYPGHHTERTCKEQLLLRDRSRLETCVTIVSSPEAVITEGIATNALETALGDEGFGAVLTVAGELGFRFDPAVAEVVHAEEWGLYAAATNASRMLHEDGISPDEAESYLREWALYSPERAAKTMRFITDPGIRTYVTAYTDGRRLCRSFVDRVDDGYRRLLTEQLTVSSLLAAGASMQGGPPR